MNYNYYHRQHPKKNYYERHFITTIKLLMECDTVASIPFCPFDFDCLPFRSGTTLFVFFDTELFCLLNF